MRGDFGTFLAKSAKEPKAIVFAKTEYNAENNKKKKRKRLFSQKHQMRQRIRKRKKKKEKSVVFAQNMLTKGMEKGKIIKKK